MALNPQQQQAVDTIDGPLLILAGAGSGKTTVLMERIANMINQGIRPWNIKAVTFTNKAANEMKERIAKHVGADAANHLHMSTFHSFCVDILKREQKNLDLFDKPFKIAEPNNSKSYLRQILKHRTKIKPSTILGYISALKNEMVDAQAFSKNRSWNTHIDWPRVRKLIEKISRDHLEVLEWAYPAYEEIMFMKNMVDFDDLILHTIHLFLKKPFILEKYQEKFQYIMVDEYQDTNRAQYILIKLLADKYRNIAVVGDENQSIYAFRGSDIRNILNFDVDYPDAKIIKLEENYRSTQTILDAANQVISHNRSQRKKTLFTKKKGGDKVLVYRADMPEDEAFFIASKIKEDVRSGKRKYSDFTVLFRSNAQSADLETMFTQENIPSVLLSGLGFYEREEIQDVVKYLQFIDNPNNIEAFERAIRKPKRRIAEKTIEKIVEQSVNGDILGILSNPTTVDRMQTKAKDESIEFAEMIKKHRNKMDSVSAASIISELLEEINYQEKVLSVYENSVQTDKKANLDKMVEMILSKEQKLGRIITVPEFVEELALYNSEDDSNKNEAVKLMTIHASKGLEFPVVFVVGMNDKTFPAFYAETPEDIEEERRMCYVAYTRAKERLVLTHSKKRMLKQPQKGGSPTQSLYGSRFLYEFSDALKETIEQTEKNKRF